MTSFEESGRLVPQVPGAGSLPKLFSDADGSAVQGAGVGVDGSTARMSFTRLGTKELIRVKLTVDRGDFLPAGEIGIVLFRFLEPVWLETVKV